MKPNRKKTPYGWLNEFNEHGRSLDMDLQIRLEVLNLRRQIRNDCKAIAHIIFTHKGRAMLIRIVFRGLACFTVVATLALVVFQFGPFWQLLSTTALGTATFLLNLPTPIAFNLMLASIVSVFILGWPIAVLRGAYLGLRS